jgi:hypothetical protein
MAMSADAAPDAALRRRLRDDPDAAAHLAELRRAAYGRGGSVDAALDALLAEEDRLVTEGRRILARDGEGTPPPASMTSTATPTPTSDPESGPHLEAARAPTRPPARRRIRRLLRPGPISVAVVALCVVAGLGTASASGLLVDDDSWRSQEPTSTPGPPSTPDPRIGMPVPEFTAEPPAQLTEPLTEAQVTEALRQEADMQWENLVAAEPGLARPDVTTERVMADREWLAQHAACLRESGVDVTLIGTGYDQRLNDVTVDPVVAYACSVRFPRAPGGPLTRAALAYSYDYSVSFLIPCYASAGEPYRGRIPSLDQYIARSEAGDPWYPVPARAVGDVATLCPQDAGLAR